MRATTSEIPLFSVNQSINKPQEKNETITNVRKKEKKRDKLHTDLKQPSLCK